MSNPCQVLSEKPLFFFSFPLIQQTTGFFAVPIDLRLQLSQIFKPPDAPSESRSASGAAPARTGLPDNRETMSPPSPRATNPRWAGCRYWSRPQSGWPSISAKEAYTPRPWGRCSPGSSSRLAVGKPEGPPTPLAVNDHALQHHGLNRFFHIQSPAFQIRKKITMNKIVIAHPARSV